MESEEKNDMFSETWNGKPSLLPTPTTWSMVVIREKDGAKDSSLHDYDDFSIFPPSNHENLIPSHPFTDPHPTFPPSPLSSPPSDIDPSTSTPSVSQVPRWWVFAIQLFRSKICSVSSYFGFDDSNINSDGKRKAFWYFGSVGFAITMLVWWLSVRVRRNWQRRQTVGKLLQIIREKDEKIIQLLNQISRTNEVLLNHHKVVASKLADQ